MLLFILCFVVVSSSWTIKRLQSCDSNSCSLIITQLGARLWLKLMLYLLYLRVLYFIHCCSWVIELEGDCMDLVRLSSFEGRLHFLKQSSYHLLLVRRLILWYFG
jgi:hypothetical protein